MPDVVTHECSVFTPLIALPARVPQNRPVCERTPCSGRHTSNPDATNGSNRAALASACRITTWRQALTAPAMARQLKWHTAQAHSRCEREGKEPCALVACSDRVCQLRS